MADQSIRTVDFPVSNGLASNDSIICLFNNGSSTNTSLVLVSNLLANSNSDFVVVNSHNLVIAGPSVPANSTANGVKGQISWDANFVYVATGTNVWKRAAISSW